MGLAERRKVKELQEVTFPERTKEIEEICGVAIPYEVDWESLADDAEALNFIDNLSCHRLNMALRTICQDDLGKEAVREGLHLVKLKNVADRATMQIRLTDGVLEMHCAYALRTDGMYSDGEIRQVLEQGSDATGHPSRGTTASEPCPARRHILPTKPAPSPRLNTSPERRKEREVDCNEHAPTLRGRRWHLAWAGRRPPARVPDPGRRPRPAAGRPGARLAADRSGRAGGAVAQTRLPADALHVQAEGPSVRRRLARRDGRGGGGHRPPHPGTWRARPRVATIGRCGIDVVATGVTNRRQFIATVSATGHLVLYGMGTLRPWRRAPLPRQPSPTRFAPRPPHRARIVITVPTSIAARSGVGHDAYGAPVVDAGTRGGAADRLSAYTGAHVGQHMALVLDGTVIADPTDPGPTLPDWQIAGLRSVEEATTIATSLKYGALPIAFTVVRG